MNEDESALSDVIRELEGTSVGNNHSQGYRMAIEDIKAWRNVYLTTLDDGCKP